MRVWERLRERSSEDVVYEVEGERRRRWRVDDALVVEAAGEWWCPVRRSRVRRLRWRRRRRLRPLLRWVRPVVAREAGGGWVVPEWVGVAAGGCV